MKYMYIYKILLILLYIKCECKNNYKCSKQYNNKYKDIEDDEIINNDNKDKNIKDDSKEYNEDNIDLDSTNSTEISYTSEDNEDLYSEENFPHEETVAAYNNKDNIKGDKNINNDYKYKDIKDDKNINNDYKYKDIKDDENINNDYKYKDIKDDKIINNDNKDINDKYNIEDINISEEQIKDKNKRRFDDFEKNFGNFSLIPHKKCALIYIAGTTNNSDIMTFIEWFKRNADIPMNYNLKFEYYNNETTDNGGVRRQIFKTTKDYILHDYKCENSGKNLFVHSKHDVPYMIFSEESKKLTVNDKIVIQLLAAIVVSSLRDRFEKQPVFINLNPLIYKIMLNDCKIKDENGKYIFTYSDLKYYFPELYKNLCKKEKLNKEELEIVYDSVDYYYEEMCKDYEKQLYQIELLYSYFNKYFIKDVFSLFKKDEYIALKYFLEGYTHVSDRDFEENIEFKYFEVHKDSRTELLVKCLFEILKDFTDQQKRGFLSLVTGIDSLQLSTKLQISFKNKIYMKDSQTVEIPFAFHTCSSLMEININFFLKDYIDNNKQPCYEEIKKRFKEQLENNIVVQYGFNAK